jgi:hypothetical protein
MPVLPQAKSKSSAIDMLRTHCAIYIVALGVFLVVLPEPRGVLFLGLALFALVGIVDFAPCVVIEVLTPPALTLRPRIGVLNGKGAGVLDATGVLIALIFCDTSKLLLIEA